jgi:hypothetical protein
MYFLMRYYDYHQGEISTPQLTLCLELHPRTYGAKRLIAREIIHSTNCVYVGSIKYIHEKERWNSQVDFRALDSKVSIVKVTISNKL